MEPARKRGMWGCWHRSRSRYQQAKETRWPIVTDTTVRVDLRLSVRRDTVAALGEDEPNQIMGVVRWITCDPVSKTIHEVFTMCLNYQLAT